MEIVNRPVSGLKPYAKNPRKNADAVKYVAASIKEFGFKVPVIIDSDGEIVAGHTRVLAAKRLGLETVPCIVADDLTPEQIKAFRLADNKTAEMAGWDFPMLEVELSGIEFDMAEFGFDNITGMIDDLLENNYSGYGEIKSGRFEVSFSFDERYKTDIDKMIKINSKAWVEDRIVKLAQEVD